MNFLTLEDMDLTGKRVIVRADFNVPVKDGKVTDDTRIKETMPTINYLLEKECKIILMSHMGRPKGKVVEELRLDLVAERLSKISGINVKKMNDSVGPEVKRAVNSMKPGEIVLLENIQFNPGENKNEPGFARQLSELADVYVNDAFGQSHREYATFCEITKFLPSCAGFLVQKEIEQLSKLINPNKPFVAIIGGAKADKIGVIKSLLPKVDQIIIGGVLANTFLKAKGVDIKASKFDEETLSSVAEFINNKKIILPVDVVAAEKFDASADAKNVPIKEIPDNWLIADIGEKTEQEYKKILGKAKTIMWGGPLGVFEIEKFAKGTKQIAEFISKSGAVTIIGGGDSAAAVNKIGLADKMTHVSTGGGASLEFIEKNGKLPGLVALEAASKR